MRATTSTAWERSATFCWRAILLLKAETFLELLIAHRQEPVPPSSLPGRDVPADLEAVIRRCLERDPANRFPDVMSLHQALAACRCADLWTESAAAQWWQAHPQTP